MKFPTARLAAALALGLVAASCTNGQTGSPDCALLPACVCRSFAGRLLFRGKLVRIDQRELRATVRVDEALGGATTDAGGVEVGSELAGSYSLGLPCEPADGLASLRVGDEVLLAYDRDGEPSQWLAHWSEELQLSDSTTVASSAVTELSDESTCGSRFQGAPDPDCNDVRTITTGCSVDVKTQHEVIRHRRCAAATACHPRCAAARRTRSTFDEKMTARAR
jgi:hypothetical protein